MWTKDELLNLSDTITQIDISQICTKEELEIIGHNSTRLNNLKSQIKVDGLQMDIQLIFSYTYGKEQSCIHFIMGLENSMALVKPYRQKLRL